MSALKDFLKMAEELKRLKDSLRVVFYDEFGNPICIRADVDPEGNPFFKFEHEYFQTIIPLQEMVKLAKWLRDIGVLEVE